jgi:YVTN family beta-propeller protein
MKLKGGKMKLLIFIKKIYWLSEKKKAENVRRFIFFTFLCFLLPAFLFSQWLETTIQVGSGPRAMVWNSTNNKVYCANERSDNVTVIDGATNQVITTIPVGSVPRAFAWNSIQNRTYVANFGSSTISVIRDATGIEEYFLPDVKPFTSEIYPNPAKSFFVIRSSLPVKEIEIFDVSGKLIKEITFSTKEPKISLKGIKTGVYLLKIKTENKEFTEKLIIK